MSRWNAAGVHLGISAFIAALVMAVLYLLWYPASYFTAMGGDKLLFLVIGVDVIIGPLVTLIIFKSGKKGLKFDLSVIAFLQALALGYGVSTAAEARPVYSVFVVDRFEVVPANAIDDSELAKVTRPEFKSLSWTGPRVVGVHKPDDPREASRIVLSLLDGKDLQHYPQHFVPYADVAAEVAHRAKPIAELERLNPQSTGLIDGFLAQHGLKPDQVGFVALRARRGLRAVIVRKNGDIVGTLDVDPWGAS